MWPLRQARANEIERLLEDFSNNVHPLQGIADAAARATLAMQMVASLRRLDYTQIIRRRTISTDRANPASDLFEPERAAESLSRLGEIDEAIWLIFLATHFGQHGKHGWRMLRDVYSGLGSGIWTWARISQNPQHFRTWLRANRARIGGAFGNHRKYETLNPDSANGTATVIESFVQVMGRSPSAWFATLTRTAGNDPAVIFDAAYKAFDVARFGRLARFDFLALLGRLGLAPVSPGSAYLKGATGPLRGARLLVDGNAESGMSPERLDQILQELDSSLGVGMQVMEDSICNWQKSPRRFVHFKG